MGLRRGTNGVSTNGVTDTYIWNVSLSLSLSLYTYIYIYIYTCIHMHIYIYIYTSIYLSLSLYIYIEREIYRYRYRERQRERYHIIICLRSPQTNQWHIVNIRPPHRWPPWTPVPWSRGVQNATRTAHRYTCLYDTSLQYNTYVMLILFSIIILH